MHRDEFGGSVIEQRKPNNVNLDVMQLFAIFFKKFTARFTQASRPTVSSVHVDNVDNKLIYGYLLCLLLMFLYYVAKVVIFG